MAKAGADRKTSHESQRGALPAEDPMEYAQMLCLARSIFKNEKAAMDWASDNGYRFKVPKHTDRDYVFVQRRASLFKPGTFHREPVRIDGVGVAGVAVILGTTRKKPVTTSKGDQKRNAKKRIKTAEKRMTQVTPEQARTLTRNVLKGYGAGLDSGEIGDALQVRGATVTAMLKAGIDSNFASWSKANYRDNWVRYVAFHMNLIAELELACQVFMEDPDSKQYTALVTARKAQAEIHDRIFERGTALGIIEVRTPEARIEPSDRLSMVESLRHELQTLTNLIAEIEVEQERTVTRVSVRMGKQADAIAKATGEPAPLPGTGAATVKVEGVKPDSPAIEVAEVKPVESTNLRIQSEIHESNKAGARGLEVGTRSGDQARGDGDAKGGDTGTVEAELASELELERAGLND